MDAADLGRIFGGREPLGDVQLEDRFLTLLGLAPGLRPFECVGDVGECRVAVELAAARSDRQGTALLHSLGAAVRAAPGAGFPGAAELLSPLGPHFVPDRYAPPDLLVRAH
jgi:hypothetical protein